MCRRVCVSTIAGTPSVADYRDTSPETGEGEVRRGGSCHSLEELS